jgi:leucyl-tRNA synthetase
LFCLFAAPPERDLEWNDDGVEGCNRFINRVWRLVLSGLEANNGAKPYRGPASALSGESKKVYIKAHQTIRKVTDDIEESFHFNTAISAVMELVNALYALEGRPVDESSREVSAFCLETVLLLLSPIVPHFSEELWQRMGHDTSIVDQDWPVYRPDSIETDDILIVVQVNGKLRGKFVTSAGTPDPELKRLALADEGVSRYIGDSPVRKVIVVAGKLVNIVI